MGNNLKKKKNHFSINIIRDEAVLFNNIKVDDII